MNDQRATRIGRPREDDLGFVADERFLQEQLAILAHIQGHQQSSQQALGKMKSCAGATTEAAGHCTVREEELPNPGKLIGATVQEQRAILLQIQQEQEGTTRQRGADEGLKYYSSAAKVGRSSSKAPPVPQMKTNDRESSGCCHPQEDAGPQVAAAAANATSGKSCCVDSGRHQATETGEKSKDSRESLARYAARDGKVTLTNGQQVHVLGIQHAALALGRKTAVVVRCFQCKALLQVDSQATNVYCIGCNVVFSMELAQEEMVRHRQGEAATASPNPTPATTKQGRCKSKVASSA